MMSIVICMSSKRIPDHGSDTEFYTVLESGVARTTELPLMMSIVICMSSKRIPDHGSDTEQNR